MCAVKSDKMRHIEITEQKSKNISGSNEAMAAGGDNFGGRPEPRFSVRS